MPPIHHRAGTKVLAPGAPLALCFPIYGSCTTTSAKRPRTSRSPHFVKLYRSRIVHVIFVLVLEDIARLILSVRTSLTLEEPVLAVRTIVDWMTTFLRSERAFPAPHIPAMHDRYVSRTIRRHDIGTRARL